MLTVPVDSRHTQVRTTSHCAGMPGTCVQWEFDLPKVAKDCIILRFLPTLLVHALDCLNAHDGNLGGTDAYQTQDTFVMKAAHVCLVMDISSSIAVNVVQDKTSRPG